MVAWHGPRKPRWRFRLLDSQDQDLGLLDGVKGGNCEVVALSRLGGSGSLTIDGRGQDIDWMRHRVQMVYDPGIPGVEPWPLATMMFTSPTLHRTATLSRFEVTLLSKMAVIDEDTVEAVYSLAAGAPIISTVVALIQSTGETRIAATPSEATLSNPLVWDAGESKLTIVNDLLQAAGYWSLWCDGAGLYRVEPYTLPADRPVSFDFAAGQTAIHRPAWDREQDLSSVPNRFLVIGQGTDEDPPLVGVALNENPDSPFSYQARGRWITATETGVEGDSQVVFDQLAQRRLLDAMSPVGKLSVSHAIVPLEQNQKVIFRPRGLTARAATIQRMRYDFTFNGHCQAEWREI
ncbi:MAG: hypothetical protein D3X82_13785 [Candidatus Leucobacter sulfamidivorax]|nr:hypothetical protein [Candidatus Leucobacter sulfamidivorax]